ncbi:MAG TPA: hypothetical protein VMW65_07745, partial [Chloroflexota bacterium]|nr:hypothetical protein [Chloroflexota bacterium]
LTTMLGGSLVFGVVALVAALGLAIWRWPMAGMTAMVVLGPPHQFLMVLVLHFTGSAVVLKFVELWKEMIILLLLAKVIDLAFRRHRSPSFFLIDLGILMFFAYCAFYLLYPSDVEGTTLSSELLGLRADTFFMVPYFIGRGASLTPRQTRFLLIAFGSISLVIGVVAGLEFVAPGATNVILNSLGYQQFIDLKVGVLEASNAVRSNDYSGFLIPRASSLVLSDLALGFFTLLAGPLAAGMLLHVSRLRDKVVTNILLLAVIGTAVLTVTRSAMIALVPSLGAIMLRTRGLIYIALIILESLMVILPIAYFLRITPAVLSQLFSTNGASVQGHLSSVLNSLAIIREYPLGRGLGTAGQVGQVTGLQGAITNEDWYLQLATEVGVPGAVIFALIVIGFGIVAFRQYGRVRDPWVRTLCLGMGGATIGFGLVGLSLHVWEAETISMVFWLFAGMVVRAQSIESEGPGGGDAHRGVA